jgi:hypothetical protein
MNNTNNVSARQSFNIAKDVLFQSWIGSFNGDRERCMAWVNNRKLSQSEIRLEVGLNITNNIFTFGVTPQQANSSNLVFPSEQRLALQDSLIVSEYGIFIGNPTSNTDSNFKLETYGNTILNSTALSAAALDGTFYSSGYFQIKVNNDTVVPYRGLFNHYYRPQTQGVSAVAAGISQDQLRGAEDGFITQEPNLLLIGSKNYVPQIVLPSNLVAVTPFVRAILIFSGVLAQNSTVIN